MKQSDNRGEIAEFASIRSARRYPIADASGIGGIRCSCSPDEAKAESGTRNALRSFRATARSAARLL